MKIYLDKNKRVTGYDVVFFQPKSPRPETNLETGQEDTIVFLTSKQDQYIRDYAQQGGLVTDLLFDGEFREEKQVIPEAVCGYNLHQTVLVETQTYTLDADLKRHLQGMETYSFQELTTIPIEKIKEQYLYPSDKLILQKEYAGKLPVGRQKRYFGLFDNEILVAFIFLLSLSDHPKIGVLYQDEQYNNAGYWILHSLITHLTKENVELLDLGGLTSEESGINQFKKKWGKVVLTKDLYNR